MTLIEIIISESHTKSGNNTWKTWDDVDSRDHYLRVTHKEWEQHLEQHLRTWDDVDSRDHYLTHKEWEQHLENMG